MSRSTEIICDHCGDSFEADTHASLTLKLSVNDSNSPSWHGGSEFDLCPKCNHLLAIFLNCERL